MRLPFNAWREGMPYYLPVLILGALLTPFLWPTAFWYLGPLAIVVGLCILAFFRDPPRRIPDDPAALVSPADGTVVAIEDLHDTEHYHGACRRISIFLSVFNVHVNRSPATARVVRTLYRTGRYKNAMSPESSRVNESNAIWLDSEFGPMTVRQISGAVARRIVCPIEPGQLFAKGEKFGMIKFGSRTELYLPPDTEICVRIKEKVRGGATIVARAAVPAPIKGSRASADHVESPNEITSEEAPRPA